MEKLRIYIAGRMSPKRNTPLHDIPRVVSHSVDVAIEAANKIFEKGHYPFAPHVSYYIHVHYSSKKDLSVLWYDYDMSILRLWANAILMLPGWEDSRGAIIELEEAKNRGYQIFYNIEDIPEVK